MTIDYTHQLLPTHGRTVSAASDTAMTITRLHHDGLAILTVHGDIDVLTSPQLSDAIASIIAHPTHQRLIIDLTPTRFLSTSAMNIMLTTHLQLPAGAFAVVAHGPSTARPMHLVGLHHTLTIHPTLTTALTAITQPTPTTPPEHN